MSRVITVDLHSMFDVRPRVLWQQLFNFYRENNCPLTEMDNILIDLKNCEDAIDETLDKESVKFVWGICPGHHDTFWRDEREWVIDLETIKALSGFDWFVLCELTDNKALFTLQQ